MVERTPTKQTSVAIGPWLTSARRTQWTVLSLIAMKPLVDAFVQRSPNLALDAGTLWATFMLVLGVFWALRQRALTWAQFLLIFSVIGLGSGSLLAAVSSPGSSRQIGLEGIRLAAGLVPAVILLGTAHRVRFSSYKGLLRIFTLGLVVHSVVAILQYLGYIRATYFQHGQPRPSGLYFHPISLGILINVALLLVVLANCRRWIRLPMAVLLSLILVGIGVLSTHRASLIVTVTILGGWPVLKTMVEATRFRINLRLVFGISAALALTTGALFAVPRSGQAAAAVLKGVVGVIRVDDLDPGAERFLRGRGERWGATVDLIAHSTWSQRLVGYGWQVADPHSDYIRAVLVHGFAGAILLLVGLGVIVLGFLARADKLGRLFIGLVVVCTLLYALTTKPTTYTFYMWAMTGMVWFASATPASERKLPKMVH